MRVVEALTGNAGRLARQIRMLTEDLEHRRRYRALAASTQGKSWALSGQEVIADPITWRVEYTNRVRTAEIEPSRTSGGYRLVFREWGGVGCGGSSTRPPRSRWLGSMSSRGVC